MERKKNDKRFRLVSAADKLFYEQGINSTTLANIASLAEVPLGNVYYYFKSKDSIIKAVIEHRRKYLDDLFADIDANATTPAAKLIKFVELNAVDSETTARFGDVLGSLCQELGKQQGEIASSAAELIEKIIKWCEVQFQAIGKGESSRALAVKLISGLQGLSLLTLSFKDPIFATDKALQLTNELVSA